MAPLVFALAESSLKSVALIAAIAITPALIGLYHQARRQRELAHKERLRALELGMPLPGAVPWPALMVILIGAGVPIAALAAALLATAIGPRAPQSADPVILTIWSRQNPPTAYYGVVWGSAAGVGITAVIAGTLLAWRLMNAQRPSDRLADPTYAAKPELLDPDAFDTVSRRG
ncbi:MAG: hypothetical protein KatS3mg108_0433 [Isosphaeraceae bacterium]|jgi:hypothetical protein|nr:MAG: hypothetical protein KatS3mg108_0433 [Isosphaeraceae bacterium]